MCSVDQITSGSKAQVWKAGNPLAIHRPGGILGPRKTGLFVRPKRGGGGLELVVCRWGPIPWFVDTPTFVAAPTKPGPKSWPASPASSRPGSAASAESSRPTGSTSAARRTVTTCGGASLGSCAACTSPIRPCPPTRRTNARWSPSKRPNCSAGCTARWQTHWA